MSMISSTPLNYNYKKKQDLILDSSLSSVSLTPILYEDVQENPKTPLLRSQYDHVVAKSHIGKLFTQVGGSADDNDTSTYATKLPNDSDHANATATSHSKLSSGAPRSILKKKNQEELIDWRRNPTKYADMLFKSEKSNEPKSRFSSSLPFSEDYLPKENNFRKKMLQYEDEMDENGHENHHEQDHHRDLDEIELALKQNNNERPKRSTKDSNPWTNTLLSIISEPSIPYTLSLYLQLLLNAVIIGFLVSLLYTFASTIRNDVNKRIEEMTFKLLKEISLCSKEYDRNNCHPSIRVPLLDKACSVWEHCMNQDPTSVGQVKISFEILLEILNGFVRLLSWKTIFVLTMLMVGSLVVTNLVFDRYRLNNYHEMVVRSRQQAVVGDEQQSVMHSPFKSSYSSILRRDISFQSPSVVRFSQNKSKYI